MHAWLCVFTGGKDYSDVNKELTFESAGQQCVDVVSHSDGMYEGDEDLSISATYSGNSNAVIVNIKDSDNGVWYPIIYSTSV